jgi:hypothetical protein
VQTPILGLERDFRSPLMYPADTARVRGFAAPGPASSSTTHGGFDDDAATRTAVINYITGAAQPVATVGMVPAPLVAAAAKARPERRKQPRRRPN